MSKQEPATELDRDELRRRLARIGLFGLVRALDEAERKPQCRSFSDFWFSFPAVTSVVAHLDLHVARIATLRSPRWKE